MSLIVSYNASSCGVCWRVWLLVETSVEWVWSLRGGVGMGVYIMVPSNVTGPRKRVLKTASKI